MNDTATPAAGTNPFSLATALALVLFGALAFIVLLWTIGAGMTDGPANDGGNHAEATGLNGYAAFARFLDAQGYRVGRTRSDNAHRRRGLLVLTPPHDADPDELSNIILERRRNGPTLVILPKWRAMRVPQSLNIEGIEDGWVILGPPEPVQWAADVTALGPLDADTSKAAGSSARWTGFGLSGSLPDADAVQSMSSGRIVSLIEDGTGQMLAGYVDDGSHHDALAEAAGSRPERIHGSDLHPVVVVAEPDLFNNYGFAREENALLASRIVAATTGGKRMPVTFDLTLNGLARKSNLLTLAFTPPFLAATLCLILAALAVGWRAFLRFGPPNRPERAIAFGKQALVANTSGFLRRTRRLHLLTGPYAERTRERIVKALALERLADAEVADKAIDRALASRDPGSTPYTQVAARLRGARTTHDAVKAAQDLHAIERTLTT